MIAKIVPIKSLRKSNFTALVNYLTDTKGTSERVGRITATNCFTDELTASLLEIQNTQAMNARARSDKTFHLILSFPENERLSDTDFSAIVVRFCDALGFSEHQRISVVHEDTDNLHIHIAINKIHPRKLTIHNPYYDYKIVAKVCEQVEQTYGLIQVNHETRLDPADRTIQDIERKTGVESLSGWIKRECLSGIKRADSWQMLHQVLSEHGLTVKEHGNGLVFVSDNGMTVKASSVGRSLSKSKLIKRLGDFEANTQASNVSPHKSKQYQPRPLQSHHGTSKLYACYQQEQSIASTRYKAEWTKLRNRRDTLIQRAKNSAQTKRSLIKAAAAGKLGKRALYKTVSLQFKMTLQTIKHDYRNDYAKLKARCQKMGWLDWLVLNAKNGDLEALEVLRSRNSKCINRTANHISGGQNPNDPHKTDSIESITRHGNILVRTGAVIVRDNGKQLIVSSKATQESYAAILETAIARYGQRLSINGDDRFKAGIVQAAAQNRIRVTFDDAKLSQFHRQLIHGQHTRSTQYKGMSR
ncbi:MAG: relaxase/mobilization nuclease domain-containing protein [Nitrosomonas sp.]|nr:relaxase/mobilization nuclease domain-containing protein [Nitrosomonas sp.]